MCHCSFNIHYLIVITERLNLQCLVWASDHWLLLVAEADETVCCLVPVSNSWKPPILLPGATTCYHCRPKVQAEAADRCGRRQSRAVDTQIDQAQCSKCLLDLHLRLDVADVVMDLFLMASFLFSSWCKLALSCCCSAYLPDDLKMSTNYNDIHHSFLTIMHNNSPLLLDVLFSFWASVWCVFFVCIMACNFFSLPV